MLTCKLTLDRELNEWLEIIPSKLRDRLASIGLIAVERAAGGKPLAEHLEDFRQAMLVDGDTEKHVNQHHTRIKRVFGECSFVYWSDISASKVQRCIAGF